MPERWWIPVLAALLGLAGGVGGAFVGGEVANKGQQQQFDNQRTAEVQDLLIEAYAGYLRDATTTWFAANSRDPEFKQHAAEALAGETEVEFLAASPDVDVAAQRLYDAVTMDRLLHTFEDRRREFIRAGGSSLNPDS